ncbi:MAG: thiamine-binding protein [Treponema sp.]|nr:thiamine-binding protein [Treponema sp.]
MVLARPEGGCQKDGAGGNSPPEASLAIQVLPKIAGDGEELIRVVDAVIAYIKGSGLTTFVGPFETTVEGSFDRLCEIAREAQLICLREGAESVSTYMKWVYNPRGGVWSIEKKVAKHHLQDAARDGGA